MNRKSELNRKLDRIWTSQKHKNYVAENDDYEAKKSAVLTWDDNVYDADEVKNEDKKLFGSGSRKTGTVGKSILKKDTNKNLNGNDVDNDRNSDGSAEKEDERSPPVDFIRRDEDVVDEQVQPPPAPTMVAATPLPAADSNVMQSGRVTVSQDLNSNAPMAASRVSVDNGNVGVRSVPSVYRSPS